MNLAHELQKIYDSEINIRISWFWDGGIDVWIGDDLNGYLAQETVTCVADVVPWLQEAIAHFYPNSTYAMSLDPAYRELATKRLFQPPKIGAEVRCPHCGSPNASRVAFDELIAFTCNHCGAAVRVEPPKVQ